jgi:hypothetical protein
VKVAQNCFGHKNITDINGADLEDYAFSIQNISEKTRSNYVSIFTDIETQEKIIDKVTPFQNISI